VPTARSQRISVRGLECLNYVTKPLNVLYKRPGQAIAGRMNAATTTREHAGFRRTPGGGVVWLRSSGNAVAVANPMSDFPWLPQCVGIGKQLQNHGVNELLHVFQVFDKLSGIDSDFTQGRHFVLLLLHVRLAYRNDSPAEIDAPQSAERLITLVQRGALYRWPCTFAHSDNAIKYSA